MDLGENTFWAKAVRRFCLATQLCYGDICILFYRITNKYNKGIHNASEVYKLDSYLVLKWNKMHSYNKLART